MKIILLRNPKHVAPAHGQPPRTQENPYPISSRLLRVTASAHGEPFLRVFPAHPAAGVTSYPENPSQGPHQTQAAGNLPTHAGRPLVFAPDADDIGQRSAKAPGSPELRQGTPQPDPAAG